MDSIRFTAPFRVQKNLLQVPFTYHRQWLRNCPKYVLFHYDGEIHFIRTLPASASKFVYGSKKSITIHHGLSKSTKWPLTIHHDVPAITQPWFNLIHEKNLKAGDEVVFYYRFHDHAWELLIRKAIEWNNSNTDPDSDD
ncbi:hypothetical protein JHK82_044816 [Glycine max]|nr:hypothetical protein JHK87_045010 [Glycine soja]KAG5099764.1 hypothetical protein JHK82_044816 [Glycine max]